MKTSDTYLLVLKHPKTNKWTSFYVYLNELGKINEVTSKPLKSKGTYNLAAVCQGDSLSTSAVALWFSSSIPYSAWNKQGYVLKHDFDFHRLTQFPAVITAATLIEYFHAHGNKEYLFENYVTAIEIPAPIKYKILNVPSSFDNQILFKEAPISICE